MLLAWPDVQPAAVVPLRMTRGGQPVPAVLACVHQDAAVTLAAGAQTLLHPNERARLDAFPSELRRLSFLLGRYAAKRAVGALRDGVVPHRLEIAAGVFGQPVVRGAADPPAVSLSHTSEVGVAVACEPEHILGVDVEDVGPRPDDVFESALAPAERAAARAAVGSATLAAGLVWALKEALSKALRCGLTAPFDVLRTEAIQPVGGGGVHCEFGNFRQYRGRAWPVGGQVLALVWPKRSELGFHPAASPDVCRVLGRGTGPAGAG